MWARLTELAFGLWLLSSPFVFDHPPSATALWVTDVLSGALLLLLTGLNYRYPSRRLYLGVLALGAWLIASAFLSGPHPLPAARQNHIMVGLAILMVGIVPNRALQPPEKWSAFERGESAGAREGSAGERRDGESASQNADRRQEQREAVSGAPRH